MINPLSPHADKLAIIATLNEIIKAVNELQQESDRVRRHMLGITRAYQREERR